jgi:hypothetical protein
MQDRVPTHRQNLNLAVMSTLRMGLVCDGNPKVVLFTTEFQLVNTPRFNTFVASIFTSRLNGFINRNVRDIELFSLKVSGPIMEFRRAVPQAPAVGAEKAATFKY